MKYGRSFRLTKNKKIKIKRFFSFLFTFIFLGFLVYFFFFSDFFYLNNIIVSGNDQATKDGVFLFVKAEANKKKLYFFDYNLLLINPESIKEEAFKYFPIISSLEIKREYPDTLRVLIKERKEIAQIYFSGKYFSLDINGIVFKEKAEKAVSLLEIESIERQESFDLGEQIIDSDLLSNLLDFYSELKNLNLEINKFILASNKRVNIEMKDGWKIYLNPQENIEWQFTKLKIVLEEYLSVEERKDLEYIELRFGNTAPVMKK